MVLLCLGPGASVLTSQFLFICRLCNFSFDNLGHVGSNDWLNSE
jgi:hypothetical protein